MTTHEQELQIKNKMIEEKNGQIVKLEMEVERLRSELHVIAYATRNRWENDKEFRVWAQDRAWHALGLKPGELTIKKG